MNVATDISRLEVTSASQDRRAIRHRNYRIATQVFVYLCLIIGCIGVLLPFVWMISTSLKQTMQIFVIPPKWIPEPIMWENYREALTSYDPNFGVFARNTLLIEVVAVPGIVFTSSLAAYSFSRMRWPGRDLCFGLVLSTMMLPGAVTLVPTFIAWSELGAVDTFAPLTIPAWFGGGAFNIFLLRQFMAAIPRELEEAALMDGAGFFHIYSRIILPLVMPALTVVTVLTFIGIWNDFMGPLIYLNSNKHYTIALGLSFFRTLHSTKWNLLMAASLATMTPIIILFVVFQKRIIEGANIMAGLKG